MIRFLPLLAALVPITVSAQTLTMEAVGTEAREGVLPSIELLIRLDAPADHVLLVEVSLSGVDASAGTDFTPSLIPVTFQPGEVVKTARVNIVDDAEDEVQRETLVATVQSVTPLDTTNPPVVVNAAPAIPLTILDNDNYFSVEAQPGPEGGAVILTITQRHDSDRREVVFAAPGAGSATPGADFEPWQKVAALAPGTTETTVAIGLMPDAEPEGDETFPVEMTHYGPGTTIFDPVRATATIIDETEPEVPVRIEYIEGTATVSYMDFTRTDRFSHPPMGATLIRHLGGTRMTLAQDNGANLELRRSCMEGIDFDGIASGIPGLSAEDIGAGNRVGWYGDFTVEGIAFDYAMFEQPDGNYFGWGRQRGDVDGAKILTLHGYRVTLLEPQPDVPRLPVDDAGSQLPPEAVTDAVARQVAADLGMTADEVRPFLSSNTAPDMTTGDGESSRPVDVTVLLDPEGRPLRADRAAPGPCDPGYGEASPATKRLRYRFGTAGDGIYAQGVIQDVETGVFEEAYMEDLGDMSGSLDNAAERAHQGLDPALKAPD
ncbi:Calx-beta domain-containing protein [Histidinibacterium aquaticum]|uniref:Calx-beta domain-containing protein n=1 Tax=Histidinibacterium aquaticum TaxID=2613962 RepID=A0A5J5GCM9_9RHOB|nr:Calx-beta domain-containing protein [Histidinibacterium aquaticum]KAA9005663.1 hypothetical protein F3S47_17315 [Histidinibacterium aquaticum]